VATSNDSLVRKPSGKPVSQPSSSSFLLSSLELNNTKVYEPQIRALLGTASQFCEVVVLNLRIDGNPYINVVSANDFFFSHTLCYLLV